MNYTTVRKMVRLKKKLSQTKGLRFIEEKLTHKSLWRFKYSSVARAFMIGMFWMMIPMHFQMVPTTIMCVYFRANIPLAIACVWISNPITWLPIYFGNYVFGSYLLGSSINIVNWKSYANYIMENINLFWQPLYLGSIVGGIILGGVCFILVYVIKFIRRD